ncbi:Cytochrome c oxidase subunit 7C, mitochondrial [Trichoplax sp. H2]|nr:Cytochrome c oxidase subunit 7C, mitochondrial [Trichoplax sp. H2]|eukprot:RDD47127.1 Cytochrome c oxidase subunit 7C, mitochondrial [Trichoplax sp. H2]
MASSGLLRIGLLGRSVVKSRSMSPIIRGDFPGGPGTSMPFQTKNKLVLMLTLGLAFGGTFSIPFLAVEFQLKKQSGDFN